MFDLIKKVVKQKFGKPEPEEPAREYMRLKLELEEICASHAMDLEYLKNMTQKNRLLFLGEEESEKVVGHFEKMHSLWPFLPPEQKEFHNSSIREDSYQEFAQDNLEREYLRLDQEIELEAAKAGLKYEDLALMSMDRKILLLGEDSLELIQKKHKRAGEIWKQFTIDQKDRNIFKRFDRTY